MNHSRKLITALAFVVAALAQASWAQETTPPLSLTGRILFGFDQYQGDNHSQGGPVATLESDLKGYWRDPRILQFEFKPRTTIGEPVPGTEAGNAVTGFGAMGKILQGSRFPLTLSYSRSNSTFEETAATTNGVLSGVKLGTTSSVFDAGWLLRFKHLPTLNLNYRDTEYTAELPTQFSSNDEHSVRSFTGQMNYSVVGWQLVGRYQRSQSKAYFPNIFGTGTEEDRDHSESAGFSATRTLPVHSNLGLSVDQSKSDFTFDGLTTNTTVRLANATLTSQPVKRINTTFQAQYTSNSQDYLLQQAVLGPGAVLPGAGGSTTSAPSPQAFFGSPLFKVLTLSSGIGVQLGHGFTMNGSLGESHAPNNGLSKQWSVGPAYHHSWHSGWFAASYSHSNMDTHTTVVSGYTGSPITPSYIFYSQGTDLDTGALNLSQNLPEHLKLTTSGHYSQGTLWENGAPLPNRDYGVYASVTRPVTEWTLTGSFSFNKNTANHSLIYNQSESKALSLGAAYRGFAVYGSQSFGSGLALQLANNVIVVNPGVITGAIGIPILSSTDGSMITGSYNSRGNRFAVRGNWGHFRFSTDRSPATSYNLYNLNGSYKLRRLRLIAGFVKQSQVFNVGRAGFFDTRLMYFQVERTFRIF